MREPTVSESIRINAAPEVVYDLVADVERMGEWSPEATGARVSNSGPQLTVGDTFTGTNKHGLARWSTQCTVTQSKRGEEFEFTVEFKPFKISTWRYEFASDGDATVVTEQWFDDRAGIRGATIKALGQTLIPGSRPEHNRRNMQVTLANLKRAAESK
jgi:ribosome-associated toxin RatA of RatAB toxin-antitoxin module